MTQKIYEVRDGGRVLGQFSSESKARSFLKQLKAEGREARIYISFADDKRSRTTEYKPKTKRPVGTQRKKVEDDKLPLEATIDMSVNEYLSTNGYQTVDNDYCFGDIIYHVDHLHQPLGRFLGHVDEDSRALIVMGIVRITNGSYDVGMIGLLNALLDSLDRGAC